jgi:hypothetical protein
LKRAKWGRKRKRKKGVKTKAKSSEELVTERKQPVPKREEHAKAGS